MKQAKVEGLAFYPEERTCRRPTTEQVFRLFGLAQHSLLLRDGAAEHVFEPELSELRPRSSRCSARPCGPTGAIDGLREIPETRIRDPRNVSPGHEDQDH